LGGREGKFGRKGEGLQGELGGRKEDGEVGMVRRVGNAPAVLPLTPPVGNDAQSLVSVPPIIKTSYAAAPLIELVV
jgi:hypothetical protein